MWVMWYLYKSRDTNFGHIFLLLSKVDTCLENYRTDLSCIKSTLGICMKCDKYMNICFKLKEIVDINTRRIFQLIGLCFKSIVRKMKIHFFTSVITNMFALPLSNCKRWRNFCQIGKFSYGIYEISLTRFFTIIHVERKMQIQLLIKQKEIFPQDDQPPVT